MASDYFMDKVRSFFGLHTQPPKSEFRNPIWGSDDDDDGDELYSKQQNIEVYTNTDFQEEFAKHVHDMLKGFGSMFGEMKTFFHDDPFHNRLEDSCTSMYDVPSESDNVDSNTIRQYYLKPGFKTSNSIEPMDVDLDGKLSSEDISGMFRKKQVPVKTPEEHLDGNLIPGRSFLQTVITTSITKPDGTIETRRIVKNGNEVIEETTTSSRPDPRGSQPGLAALSSTGIILSDLTSLLRNFY